MIVSYLVVGESEGHRGWGPQLDEEGSGGWELHLVEGEDHGERKQGVGEGHRQWGPNLEEQYNLVNQNSH